MFPTLRHGIAVNASDKRCTNFALQCFYQANTCMYSYFRCIMNSIIMEFSRRVLIIDKSVDATATSMETFSMIEIFIFER